MNLLLTKIDSAESVCILQVLTPPMEADSAGALP